MSGYVKPFKVKYGNKDKNYEEMSFRIDYQKLLEKNKTIWTKIEHLKNIELNALPVYDDKYIKNKTRTHGVKFYTKLRGLNVPEDDIEWETFTIIFTDSLLVYEKNITCKYI